MTTPTLASEDLVSHTLQFAGERLTVYNFAADQLINQSLSRQGVWEPWQLTLMRRIIRDDFNCVDVGANIGINAMFMARCCPKGRVVAFEPFNAIYDVLRKNITANGLQNLTAVNKGISDSARTMHMVTNVNMVGGAHITEGDVNAADHVGGDFRFGRLDQELREQGMNHIDFMKIDVEGHELQVLASADRFLQNRSLQLIVEFNPAQLRQAISTTSPFPDRRLFSLLRSHFRHIFYMNRDQTLTELKDYHALRRQMIGGFFVDDLYCTNTIVPDMSDLINDSTILSPSNRVVRHNVGGLTVTSYNRDLDGWALGNNYHPATMSLTVEGEPWRQLTIKLERVYKKHLHLAGYTSWPVWVLVGDVGLTFDLLDAPAQFTIETCGEPLDITIQSEHQTPAAVYLGNPTDTRHVGMQVSFESNAQCVMRNA